jgi:hypothetical protein
MLLQVMRSSLLLLIGLISHRRIDWVTAPPATISEALNRLAAHLVAGGGAAPGPIA